MNARCRTAGQPGHAHHGAQQQHADAGHSQQRRCEGAVAQHLLKVVVQVRGAGDARAQIQSDEHDGEQSERCEKRCLRAGVRGRMPGYVAVFESLCHYLSPKTLGD
ncbi:hypothetical protein AOC05_13425 [Arthrobacter alpinus]|uniref:Uncharacterized protein n=1 Tax=Arthrobacter alpinus TaxID=656366 RepID=A0A0M5M3I2_9MICC|nr:hypothetical protein AOC05_13425 [Arthrobacter alpinus]